LSDSLEQARLIIHVVTCLIDHLLANPFGCRRFNPAKDQNQQVNQVINDLRLLIGIGVAILSSVIPFSLELEALRRISARVFGILMSLDPAVAALIGLVVLRETVGLRGLIAMTLIIVASGGVSFVRKQDNS